MDRQCRLFQKRFPALGNLLFHRSYRAGLRIPGELNGNMETFKDFVFFVPKVDHTGINTYQDGHQLTMSPACRSGLHC